MADLNLQNMPLLGSTTPPTTPTTPGVFGAPANVQNNPVPGGSTGDTNFTRTTTPAKPVTPTPPVSTFTPTKAQGVLTPAMKQDLQNNAPETLVAPTRTQFNSDAAFQEAQNKFSQYGNWASLEANQTSPAQTTTPNQFDPKTGLYSSGSNIITPPAQTTTPPAIGTTPAAGTTPTTPTYDVQTRAGLTDQPSDSSKVTNQTASTGYKFMYDSNGNAVQVPKNNSDALQEQNDQIQKDAEIFATTVNNIQNGTTPLTPGEQAQIDGLKQQFQQLIDQQVLTNKNASGVANIRGYQTGAAEYDPTFATKTIGSIVTAGQNKIADLQIKEASAIASLTQSFKDNDVNKIKIAYDTLNAAKKDRQVVLEKMVTDAQTVIKDAATAKQNADKLALDTLIHSDTVSYQDKQLAISRATLDETIRKNKQAEALTSSIGTPGGLPTVTSAPATGVVDSKSQQDFLNVLPGGATGSLATLIKGIAGYDIDPKSLTTSQKQALGGLTQSDAVTLAKQYFPGYSEAQYAANASYLKGLTGTTLTSAGGIINSANKVINHMTEFADSVDKLGNGWFSSVNNFDNAATLNQTQKMNYSAAQTAAIGVKDELAKFFKGSGASDVNSIADWGAKIDPNSSPAQLKGTVQSALNLLSGQLNPMIDQYKVTLGKEPQVGLFLKQDTIKNLSDLKNKGFQIDIPGVNYTDKGSWQKYGGGDQNQWNDAVDLLTKNNIPLTNENILQAAQLN